MSALEVVEILIPRFGGEVIATYSFPSFKENFSVEDGKISNEEINNEIVAKLHQFEALLK